MTDHLSPEQVAKQIAPELRTLVEFASSFADITFKKNQQIAPMFHAIDAKGQHHVVPAVNADSKDRAFAMIRAFLELNDCVTVLYLDEAWALRKATRAEVEQASNFGVRNMPDRCEIVMISVEDSRHGMVMAERDIIRHKKGKAELGPLHYYPVTEMEGRMVGLLPKRGTSQ